MIRLEALTFLSDNDDIHKVLFDKWIALLSQDHRKLYHIFEVQFFELAAGNCSLRMKFGTRIATKHKDISLSIEMFHFMIYTIF